MNGSDKVLLDSLGVLGWGSSTTISIGKAILIMQVVLDRLMLSSLSEANDPFFLEQNEIEAILYFGQGGIFNDDIKLYHRSCEKDGHLTDEELRDGIIFLRETLGKGLRVLAVSQTGATILTVYLTEMGFSMAQALQMIGKSANDPQPDMDTLRSHESKMEIRRNIKVH